NFDLSAVGAQYASQLTSVTVHWTSASELPTVTGDPCFPYSGRILYVPDGTKSIYQAADYWKNFNIVEIKEPKGLVFIGNSLTANPYNYIIWPMGPTDSKYFAYDARGMAASVTGNDFVSQVIHGFFGKTRAQIDSEAGSIEARQDFYAIASPKLNEISSDNRIEKHLDYLNTNEQTGIANMDKMFTQQNININGDLHEADATIWPKYAIVQFGENIAGPNATEINAAYRNVYKYFIDHTCVQHIYQVFAYNNTVGAAIQTAVSDMQSYAASKGKTLEYVDVSTVVGVGYFQNKDFILKDDGTEFKLDDAIFDFSAVRGHPSDIGHNAIAQEVLKAIYAEDPMKREQALARIGQPNTIYYPDNGVTANVSTTYEVGGNGKWMKNGVVNLRCKVTDSEYAELWTGGLRFTDMSGNAITGTGYPYGYVDEDGIRHFYFKDYTTDMNVYMDYNPVALIETSGNSTTIGHFKKSHSVSVTRNTKAGVWNTICLPFKPTAAQLKQMFGDGVEIQAFTEVRKGTSGIDLVFAAIIDLNNFQAGVPYIVKPTSEALKTGVTLENVTFTAATAGSVTHSYDGDNYTFKGIYDPFAVTGENQKESNILFLSEGGLSYPKNNGDIKPFRCYFQISGQTVNLSRTNVVFGGETNAISSMPMSQEKQEMNMDRIFTIDGRFVGHSLKGLKKGLYIQNGKKIVID
ncbi:MAG: hypothetical protein Q3994_04200, partial [Prevotella sp.]|nr:hypothetical protein [Prevotella sp.]